MISSRQNVLYRIVCIGNKNEFFNSLVNIIKVNPSYRDGSARIHIAPDGNSIEFECSLPEIQSSFPDLKNKLTQSSRFTERNLSKYVYDWNKFCQFEIVTTLEELKQELCNDAWKYLCTIDLKKLELPINNLPNQPDELLISLAESAQCVTIGEDSHGDSYPKELLIKNMLKLKNAGIQVIFMEHLLDNTQRDLLAAYMNSTATVMPVALKNYLKYLDDGFNINNQLYNFTNLVVSAKQHGIKIIPIDTHVSYAENEFNLNNNETSSQRRGLMMSYIAAQNIIEYLKNNPEAKILVFCGSYHINQYYSGIPGMQEITGSPTVVINSVSSNSKFNTIKNANDHLTKPDVFIYKNDDNAVIVSIKKCDQIVEPSRLKMNSIFSNVCSNSNIKLNLSSEEVQNLFEDLKLLLPLNEEQKKELILCPIMTNGAVEFIGIAHPNEKIRANIDNFLVNTCGLIDQGNQPEFFRKMIQKNENQEQEKGRAIKIYPLIYKLKNLNLKKIKLI